MTVQHIIRKVISFITFLFTLYTDIRVCSRYVQSHDEIIGLHGGFDQTKPNNGRGIHNVENKTEYVGEDVGISTLSNANTENC